MVPPELLAPPELDELPPPPELDVVPGSPLEGGRRALARGLGGRTTRGRQSQEQQDRSELSHVISEGFTGPRGGASGLSGGSRGFVSTSNTFAGKVALVTGASSGIGLEVAKQLHARGAMVALVARSTHTLDAVVTELGGDRAAAFPLDVTDRTGLAALPAAVVRRFGRLDYVINNAGAHHRGAVRERSAEELVQMVETNLTAPILLTRAALDSLTSDGVVVNVASLAGKVPVPNAATYSGTKFGLRAFGRALGLELQQAGSRVRITTVNPGPVDTGFFGEDLSRVANLVFSQPMSTVGEVAAAVLRVIEDPAHDEIDVPGPSGALATLGYLSPRLYSALRPVMERVGARNKRRYEAERAGKS